MKDTAFLADMQQASLEVDARSGSQVEGIVNELLSLPPELATRLSEIRK